MEGGHRERESERERERKERERGREQMLLNYRILKKILLIL